AREIAAGDRSGDLGDVAHLRGQVRCQQVDRIGEVLPGAGDAGHYGLAAQPTIGADLAGDARHLGGERAQLLDHGVQRFLEQKDFATHVDRDLLREIAAGDRGGDLGDVANLCGQVRGHEVDVVGQVLPGAGDSADVGLSAQAPFGADLARHARYFRRERVELVDHRIDGLLELQDFAADIDSDFL